MREIINRLVKEQDVNDEELLCLFSLQEKDRKYLHAQARKKAQSIFGNKIYVRALIEISNYCKNNCYYCGIRNENKNLHRYRLTKDEILTCAKQAYDLGFRTLVLQGGEDLYFNDDTLCEIIHALRDRYPDCAITLSLGEKEASSYQKYYEAGANRYLLRHETIVESHYNALHPQSMSLDHRIHCLKELKRIGFQTGAGIMVGSPYQKKEYLIKDIRFLQELQPEMIGIGPFLPHHDTPFKEEAKGSLEDTLSLLSILRLLFPQVLLPATTALGTIQEGGREAGILAGANVVMPNVSPQTFRKDYSLYDNKICTDEEAIEGLEKLQERLAKIGYEISWQRGDYRKEEE